MKNVLLEYGWYMYHSCTCGGTRKEKFKHPSKPGAEFWIYPRRNTWEYRIAKRRNDNGVGEASLKNKLETV